MPREVSETYVALHKLVTNAIHPLLQAIAMGSEGIDNYRNYLNHFLHAKSLLSFSLPFYTRFNCPSISLAFSP
jgi:hypothetical protein